MARNRRTESASLTRSARRPTGLSSRAIVRVALDGQEAREVERYSMRERIRSIEEGPDGVLWVLEDERGGSGGRMLKLTPR